MHPGVQGDGVQNSFPAPAVVRRSQDQPLQVIAPRDPKTRRRPHYAPKPLAIPVQTALVGTGIYTRPTASIWAHKKYRSENRRDPLRHTKVVRVHLPPLEYIEHKPSII